MARGWAGERPRHPTCLQGGSRWGRARPLSPYTLGRKTLFLFVFINFTCVTYRQ